MYKYPWSRHQCRTISVSSFSFLFGMFFFRHILSDGCCILKSLNIMFRTVDFTNLAAGFPCMESGDVFLTLLLGDKFGGSRQKQVETANPSPRLARLQLTLGCLVCLQSQPMTKIAGSSFWWDSKESFATIYHLHSLEIKSQIWERPIYPIAAFMSGLRSRTWDVTSGPRGVMMCSY